MIKNKKITIQDIAKLANVSTGTIDRVLHNRGKVSADKKEKIESAIKELNYNPNLLARTLALGKHFLVCTLFPQAMDSEDYWHLPCQGVKQTAAEYQDFGFSIETIVYNQFDETSFLHQADLLLQLNPDGVIFAPLFEKESLLFIKKLEKYNIPYAFIDANIPNQNNITYIGPNTERSGYMAGKLFPTLLNVNNEILILNEVKGIDNSTNFLNIEKGFKNLFSKEFPEQQKKISSLNINSSDEETVFKELTKFYIKNPGTKGVLVTNSRAYQVAHFHEVHDLDIKLMGFDLVEKNQYYLKIGKIDCIISQSPIQQGKRAIKTMFDLLYYKTTPVETQYIPLDIIIKENLEFKVNSF